MRYARLAITGRVVLRGKAKPGVSLGRKATDLAAQADIDIMLGSKLRGRSPGYYLLEESLNVKSWRIK
jgi:hypothetical protein